MPTHSSSTTTSTRTITPAARHDGLRRALLIAATLGVAILSVQRTMGVVLARSAPDLAIRISPGNALALVTAANRLFAADPVRNATAAGQLAERSLRTQAPNAAALRVLAYAADVHRQPGRAAALIDLSTRLSRRDLGAQIWLIEQSVQKGDIVAALRHYDIALRTTDRTAALLYPVLTDALDERPIRDAFRTYVRERPFWMEAFLAYAIAYTKHSDRLADLLLGTPGALPDPRNVELDRRLIGRLLADGWLDQAKRVYVATPGGSSARLTSPAFNRRDLTGQDGVIGWRLPATTTAQATLDAGVGNTAVLHVEASGNTGVRIAEKPLFLPPARYRLMIRTVPSRPDSGSSLRWQLDCVTGSQRSVLWTRDGPIGDFVVPFAVPLGCGMQVLALDIPGQEGRQEASVDVTEIAVHGD